MRKNRTILITGASGMAGQSLVRLMHSQGFENLLTPSSKTLNLLDPALTESYFHEQKPSYVVHLAGHIGGIKASITRPVEFMQENLMMAMHQFLTYIQVNNIEQSIDLLLLI